MDNSLSVNQSLLGQFAPERNIYGRSGKLFIQRVAHFGHNRPSGEKGTERLTSTEWLANVTNISATLSVDKKEVRSVGLLDVKYKTGATTGEGTLTIDKVSSYFEEFFLDPDRFAIKGYYNQPAFFLNISLEDPGLPGIKYDDKGFAKDGHEMITLHTVKFWTLPMGYSTTDVVSRDMDFTFQSATWAGDSNNLHKINDPGSYQFPRRLC